MEILSNTRERSTKDELPAATLRQPLRTVEAERAHGRQVVEREQTGVLARRAVDMLVPHPRRHDEDVALLPVEPLAADDRVTGTLGALEDEIADLAMRQRVLAGAQQLHRCADR